MTRSAAADDAPQDETKAAQLALILESWSDALGQPCDETLTWEEAGGDSLATLHLLDCLEKRTGRKLTFDDFQPDMTLAELARAVIDGPRGPQATPGSAGLPTVYLFPGMFGDEPTLAALRRALADEVRFEVIDHPGVTAPRAFLLDLPRIGRAAAQEIARRQDSGAIHLAGYSFGGGVAFEAARCLAAEGREIGLLAILDTTLTASSPLRFERPRRMMLRGLGRADAARRMAIVLIDRWLPAWAAAARRRFLLNLTLDAIRRWRPEPLAVRALLAVSDEFAGRIVEPWRRLCPGIRVVHIPARHSSLFAPAALEVLVPALKEALASARRPSAAVATVCQPTRAQGAGTPVRSI